MQGSNNRAPAKALFKYRVFNVLKTWLDQHYNETLDADILDSIQEFATDIMAKDTQVRMPSQQLIKAVQRRVSPTGFVRDVSKLTLSQYSKAMVTFSRGE